MADFTPPPLSSWEGPAPAAPPPAAQPSTPASGGDWWSANAPPAKAAPATQEAKKPYRKIPPGTKVLGSPILPAEGLVFSAVAEGLSKLDQILGITGDTGDKPSYRKNGPKPHTPILGAPVTPKPGVAPEAEAVAPAVKKATAQPPKATKAAPAPAAAAAAPEPPVAPPAPEPQPVAPVQAESPAATPEEPVEEQAPAPAETPAPNAIKANVNPAEGERAGKINIGRLKDGSPGVSVETDPDLSRRRSIVYRDANGKPQGYLQFYLDDDLKNVAPKDHGLYPEVFVSPEARRQGIATKLYDEAKNQGFDLSGVSGTETTPNGASFLNKRNGSHEKTDSAQPPADGKALWKKGDAVPAYDQVVNIDPHDLKPDPARFQYKQEAIGKGGTTDEFRDVKEWDPGLGGAMAVWQDPATGEVHPINGHHRTEMAQRTNPPHVNVRFIDAKTPTEARTFGAMLNIGEGKGTALDAAKLFRDSDVTPADLAKYKISPSSKLAVQGMALSKLEPSIYRMVVDGKMTPTRGALIGDLLGEDPAAQKAAVDFFKASDKTGNRYDNAEAADIIRSIKSAPEATEEIENLFGVDEVKRNLFGERAQVSSAIGKRLAKEKSLFKLVSKQSNADRLGSAGNIINAEDNAKISQEAAQVLAVYDKLKFSAGPVAEALNDAAKEVAQGVDVENASERAYAKIKSEFDRVLGGKPADAGKGASAAKSGKGN